MAFGDTKLPAFVFETTTTTGTGTYTLAGAETLNGKTFRTFASKVGTGKKCVYTVYDDDNDEVCIGTLTVGASTTLTRDTVLESSNGGSAVNWGAGTRNVLIAPVGVLLQGLLDVDTTAGIPARTSATAWAFRTLTAGDGAAVTNGDGAAGNPTIGLTLDGATLSKSGSGVKVADGGVGPTQLATSAVETAKINDNAVTLGKLAHGTQGGVLYYGASGAPTELAAGTDGYVLTAAGAGANPAWEALPGSLGLKAVTVFTAGGTWNRASGVTAIEVEVLSGGGGGGGGWGDSGSSPAPSGGAGGASSFGAHCSATGGSGGTGAASGPTGGAAGAGGAGSSGDLNITSLNYQSGMIPAPLGLGFGGNVFAAPTGYGAGGSGGAAGTSGATGGPGGPGGYARKYIDVSAISSETVTIGASGTAGSGSGAGAGAGQAGAGGLVIVREY